jgi:hypothetical protein
VAKFLRDYFCRKGSLSDLDVNWFGSPKQLAELERAATRARSRGSLILASHTFERWPPQWVGSGELDSERSKTLKARAQGITSGGLARPLSNIAVFWLSHAAVGLVDVISVFGHLLCLLRLADEHSVDFALQYELRLQARILEAVKRNGSTLDINSRIMTIDPRLLDELRFGPSHTGRGRNRGRQAAEDGEPQAAPSSASKPPKVTPSKAEKAPPAPRTAANSRKSGSTGTKPSVAPASSGSSGKSKDKICFDHNSVQGLSCSKGSSCTYLHLDTNQPDELLRWSRAKASFDAQAARRARSGGKRL